MVDAYGSSQEHIVGLKKWGLVELDHHHETQAAVTTPLLWCHCHFPMSRSLVGVAEFLFG
jgi:hypothetical protein